MRIVEVVNNLEIGGAERLAVDLSVKLRSRGHSVDVVCLRGQGPLAAPLGEAGIEIFSLGKSEGFQVGVIWKLARFLRSRRIQVVHTHNPIVHHYGVMAGRIAGVPVIVNTLHGFGNLNDSRKTRWIYDLSCTLSTQTVSVCHALDTHLRRVTFMAQRKASVIPNGIPLERFTSIRPERSRAEFVFGAVGRLAPVKDHQMLLRAFADLSSRYPHARLRILGDGPLREPLLSLAGELGLADRVRLERFTLDVPTFLAQVDAFVISSLTEGQPLTLIEAMAAALPVIATRVGGVPEAVLGAGCGWLAAPASASELSSAMAAAIEANDLTELGLRGRRYALQTHSLLAMAEGYEKLFEQFLERHIPAPRSAYERNPRAEF